MHYLKIIGWLWKLKHAKRGIRGKLVSLFVFLTNLNTVSPVENVLKIDNDSYLVLLLAVKGSLLENTRDLIY